MFAPRAEITSQPDDPARLAAVREEWWVWYALEWSRTDPEAKRSGTTNWPGFPNQRAACENQDFCTTIWPQQNQWVTPRNNQVQNWSAICPKRPRSTSGELRWPGAEN
jgi:hypothetical protein